MLRIKRGRMKRLGLTVILLMLAICVFSMINNIPDLDQVDLIQKDEKVTGFRDLLPGEAWSQSVYAYKDFDCLMLPGSVAGFKGSLHVEVTQNSQLLFSGNLLFDPDQQEQKIKISGRKGPFLIHLLNCGEQTQPLPLVSQFSYHVDHCTESDSPLLQIGVSRSANSARWIYYAVSLILFILSLWLIWDREGKWNLRKAVILILVVCFVYMLLFPAWNINDFHMHFMTSYSYVNSLLGIKADEPDCLMVREEDRDFFTYVLHDPYQPFYQPTRRSYDDAIGYVFHLSQDNEMVPFTEYNPVHRENGPWSYIPYMLAILIARFLSLNLITAIFLARLFGIAFHVIIIYAALRKMPGALSFPVTILSCVPVCAMNLTAVTYDSPCYVAILYFFACIVSLRRKYQVRDVVSLIICSLIIGLVKRGAYTPIVLSLPLLLCKRDKRMNRLVLISMAFAFLGLIFNYRNIILGRISPARFNVEGYGTYNIKWAVEHPGNYLVLMARTYLRQTDKIFSVIGHQLGWNEAVIPEIVCGLFYVLLFFSALSGQGTDTIEPFSLGEKAWLWLPISIMIVLLPATMLSYTFVTMETIDDPQGRYYLPLLIPLLILCHSNLRKSITYRADNISMIHSSVGFLTLLSVYYIGLAFLHI